jgi:hypothetical protein
MSDKIGFLKISDINGVEKIVNTKLPWGRERRVLKIVGDLITELPADILGGGIKEPGVALLEFITTQAPEKVTDIVAIILGVSADDVDEQFDGDAVFEFIIPFVVQYSEKWTKRLEQIPSGVMPGTLAAPLQPPVAERVAPAPKIKAPAVKSSE